MERQAIERLAMDMALGELNDDAAALFEAYLVEHPEAQQWVRPMKAICRRTQEAIDAKAGSAALSGGHRAAPVRRVVRVRLSNGSRWAAVVIVSLAIGAAAGRRLASPSEPISYPVGSVETARSFVQRDWQMVLNGQGRGFWEAKAVAVLRREPVPVDDSYEPKPSPWEMLKQHQKERRHAL